MSYRPPTQMNADCYVNGGCGVLGLTRSLLSGITSCDQLLTRLVDGSSLSIGFWIPDVNGHVEVTVGGQLGVPAPRAGDMAAVEEVSGTPGSTCELASLSVRHGHKLLAMPRAP
jgi:hypothetical protein